MAKFFMRGSRGVQCRRTEVKNCTYKKEREMKGNGRDELSFVVVLHVCTRIKVVLICIGSSPANILLERTWKEFRDFRDPKLQQLASRLPGTILTSRAESTVKNTQKPSGDGKPG